ncbi:MAG: Tricarboxylate/iron carrier [Podila humilis]|nr:MAG: Tricarboxylate/iron carrier [Podila humilis]
MSCFVPTNMLVAAGMLMPNPTVKSIIFWQWANQSINVAFNSANSNKTTEMNMKETAACARMTSISPGLRTILGRLVPFTAVAAAGTVNVFLMRGKEISEGIDVYDHEGKSVGKSQKAGMSAITQVAISRVLTNFPVLTIPPLVLSQWERTSWAQQYPKAVIPINLAVISLVLMSALPLAIAAFPQYANVEVHTLEERFWNLKDSKGEPIKTLTYNKGL